MEIQNHHYNPVVIRYNQAGVKGVPELYVAAKYQKWFNLVFRKPYNFPLSFEFTAVDAIRETRITVNKHASVLYQPKGRYDNLILNIGGPGNNILHCIMYLYNVV